MSFVPFVIRWGGGGGRVWRKNNTYWNLLSDYHLFKDMTITVLVSKIYVLEVQNDVSYLLVPNIYIYTVFARVIWALFFYFGR